MIIGSSIFELKTKIKNDTSRRMCRFVYKYKLEESVDQIF